LKYLNINENRKDIDRYKFVVLFLLIVVLFGFLNIKSVKIYARIGYNGFLFPHSYSGDVSRPSIEYSCGKRNPLYPIRSASFVSIILYPIHIVVILCSVSSVKIKGDCVRIVYIGGIDDHHCLNVFLIKENKNINTTAQDNLKNIILVSVNNKYIV
jgi:hypothetical protein